MKKIYLPLIPVALIGFLYFSSIFTNALPHQTVFAQTGVTPTLYCLSPNCPNPSTSASPQPSSVTANISVTTSIVPSTTTATTTSATPCSNNGLQAPPQSQSNTTAVNERRGGHHEGGFLFKFFELLLLMLEVILKLGGGGLPCSPTVSVTPSVAPVSSAPSSVVSSAPTTATTPAPTTATTPGTSNPGTGTKTPNQILDLNNWELTIPVGAPTIIKNPQLVNGYTDQYFHVDSTNTGVVFHAPVNGTTTPNSSYPRSELREMTNNGTTEASWSPSNGTSTMTIDEAVTTVPQTKKHIVIGQIHDASSDVLVIRLEMPKLFVDIGGTVGPTLDANYTLGKRFTVKIEATGGKTNVYYNNSTTPAYTMTTAYSNAYFKAGAYTQSNCTKETQCDANNFGESIIYKLAVTHQ